MSRGARVTRSATARTRDIVQNQKDEAPSVKQEYQTPEKPSRTARKRASASSTIEQVPRSRKRVKKEEEEEDDDDEKEPTLSPSDRDVLTITPSSSPKKPRQKPKSVPASTTHLKDKKLKSYAQFTHKSPFPNFHHPTPRECKLAHTILTTLHGPRDRPTKVIASTERAGCGDSPSVLDALVRTILSQNTSDTNSTRAKKSMDKIYGGSDNWEAIAEGGQSKLQETIKCGGLAVVKSKVILSILEQVRAKYGAYSLDHLHTADSETAMTELLGFQGVGPKTASCVLLFCLRRESFAVDTHVWRITGLLGWRPASASRDETYAHLDVMVPDEDKYGLHILLVTHGKSCHECRAGGKNSGKCELRKAFAKQRKADGLKSEEMDDVPTEPELKEEEEVGS